MSNLALNAPHGHLLVARAPRIVNLTLSLFALVFAAAWSPALADGTAATVHVISCQQLEQLCERRGQFQMALGETGPPFNVSLPTDCQDYLQAAIQAGGSWNSGGIMPPTTTTPRPIACSF